MHEEKQDQRLKMEAAMKTHDHEIVKYFYLGSLMQWYPPNHNPIFEPSRRHIVAREGYNFLEIRVK
jgi:hypothetical protein